MAVIARIIGGAGTGKTTELMRLMGMTLDAGVSDPLKIGFVSFTRAARREAAERAADRFGGSVEELEERGWFRTLHSVCYKIVEARSAAMITNNAESRKWIEESVDSKIEGSAASDDPFGEVFAYSVTTDAGAALSLWSCARNRLESFDDAWRRADLVSDSLADLDRCREIVERYEQAKRLDDRMDFTDLLGRFAGYKFTVDGAERCTPEGDVPYLPVWFFDEQQDTSPLLDEVCKRLIEPSKWVYVVGDPFQSIFGWAGSDGSLFRKWDVAHERILQKSYRCPPDIHYLGEEILRECSDYFDRGIAPADHGGEVDRDYFRGSCIEDIDPSESWLLLARTNYHVARIVRRVNEAGFPWLPTKGNGGWNAPARNEANEGLWALQQGMVIRGSRWKRIVDHLPAKHDGAELLVRGTKTQWAELKGKEIDERYPRPMLLDELPGATPRLVDVIRSGAWRSIADGGDAWANAVDRWGEDVAKNPRIRVGTIHSVKGAEADHVLWLTTLTNQIRKGRQDQAVDDEERRLGYVAVTRARKRLIIAQEPNASYRFEVPS